MRAPNAKSIMRRMTLAATFAAFASLGMPSDAQAASITGKWKGSGTVSLKSGGKETVRCSVTYGRAGGKTFSVNARCASGAGRVDQTGVLKRVTNTKYVGTVKNMQYSVVAKVTVNVNGTKQNVKISSSKGTARLQLARR